VKEPRWGVAGSLSGGQKDVGVLKELKD